MDWKPIEGVNIIGVGHKARQGKDTIANYLVEKYGAQKFAFADALYDVARVVYGMEEKDGPLLQILGTDIFRKRDPDIWVKTLYRKLEDKKPRLVVIADCRFENEAQMIKDMGGSLIKVERYNVDGERFVAMDRPTNHPSEIALDIYSDWSITIKAKTDEFNHIHQALDKFMHNMKIIGRI